MPDFHPDLHLARFLPRQVIFPRTLWINRLLMQLSDAVSRSKAEEMEVEPGVSVWVHRPKDNDGPHPALLWLHGGGLAAALCLMVREQETVSPTYQLLVYPMLDDRTTWAHGCRRRCRRTVLLNLERGQQPIRLAGLPR